MDCTACISPSGVPIFIGVFIVDAPCAETACAGASAKSAASDSRAPRPLNGGGALNFISMTSPPTRRQRANAVVRAPNSHRLPDQSETLVARHASHRPPHPRASASRARCPPCAAPRDTADACTFPRSAVPRWSPQGSTLLSLGSPFVHGGSAAIIVVIILRSNLKTLHGAADPKTVPPARLRHAERIRGRQRIANMTTACPVERLTPPPPSYARKGVTIAVTCALVSGSSNASVAAVAPPLAA